MSYSRRAEIYDVEYVEDRDRDFVLSLIGETDRVLEIPCGAGRLSRWIAAKAAELTVVDLEPNMVARTLERACPGAKARVGGRVADMRTLDLGREYDVALIPREALQLLAPAEAARALAAIGSHVARGGLMFVDLATFTPARGDPDYYDRAAADGTWRANWTRRLEAGAELTRRSRQTLEKDAILFELDYRIHGDGRETDSWQSGMRLFRYDRAFVEAAAPLGMSLIAIYGGYDKTDFSAVAPRLLALYQKSA
jgi:SAM-dependent methyltransferase